MRKLLLLLMLLIGSCIGSYADVGNVAVKGVVVDSKKNPVVGATITSSEGDILGTTDIDGSFMVEAPASSKITVSYVGLEKTSKKVSPDMGTIVLNAGKLKNGLYVDLGFTPGTDFGYAAAVGYNHGLLNVEAFVVGLIDFYDEVYLSHSMDGGLSYDTWNIYPSSEYILGAKLGVNINASSRFRLTPQIGIQYAPVQLSDEDNHSYCTSGLAGVRLFYAFSRRFGLSFSPYYYFGISQGDIYKQVADCGDTFKDLRHGLDLRASIVFTF